MISETLAMDTRLGLLIVYFCENLSRVLTPVNPRTTKTIPFVQASKVKLPSATNANPPITKAQNLVLVKNANLFIFLLIKQIV